MVRRIVFVNKLFRSLNPFFLLASYKPILEEVEKILAEAGLDAEEMKRVGAGGAASSAGSRNRR